MFFHCHMCTMWTTTAQNRPRRKTNGFVSLRVWISGGFVVEVRNFDFGNSLRGKHDFFRCSISSTSTPQMVSTSLYSRLLNLQHRLRFRYPHTTERPGPNGLEFATTLRPLRNETHKQIQLQ
jgi:hypothetical protein